MVSYTQSLTSSKSTLFRVFKAMLKRRSVSGIEQVEANFDKCLSETLKLYRGSGANVCKKNDTTAKVVPRVLHRTLGEDVMQSYDITVSVQVLALYARTNALRNPRAIYPFICRLNMLIIATEHYIHEFSFVKIALVLNSLANILNAKVVPNKKGHESLLKVSVPKEYVSSNFNQLYEACKDRETSGIHDALNRLNRLIESHLKSLLFLNIFHKNEHLKDLKAGEPDSHSICMILKYYSLFSKIDEKLLYLIYLWIKEFKEWKVMDLINITRSVTKLYSVSDAVNLEMFEKTLVEDVKRTPFFLNNPQIHPACNKAIVFHGKKTVVNVVQLVLSHVTRVKFHDNPTLEQIQTYIHSLNTAYTGGICKKLDVHDRFMELITCANVVLEHDKDATNFINLLYFANSAHTELDIIEFNTLASLLFTNDNIKILLQLEPEILPRGDPSNLTKTLLYLNTLEKNKKQLALNEIKIIDKLFNKFLKYASDVIKDTRTFAISEIITLKKISNNYNSDLKNHLLNIYSNALSNRKGLSYMLKQTDDLFVFLYSSNWNIGDGLHNVIGSFLSKNSAEFVKHDIYVFLRLIQNISRLYRINKHWSTIYDMKLFLQNIFNSNWEAHIELLIDIIFNSVTNTSLDVNEVTSVLVLEELFHKYYLQMSNPLEGDAKNVTHSNVNITLFSKFFHLSWLLKGKSAKLHEIWANGLLVLLDCNTLFKNKCTSNDGKPAFQPLNSHNWSSFSAIIVIDTLLSLNTQDFKSPLSCGDHKKIFEAIDSIFLSVIEHISTFGDKYSHISRLYEFIINSNQRLMPCNNLERIASSLHSFLAKDNA
ncbi:hypothetical protein BEWA_031900 [Theileria equi strain WA]|uniref:Uncharacterized protein n=1 Tax=Theileria equi strain WA TaxID=1537102 RepID=L0AXP2_THEEQ|nr:hypothetical protein BEWA_031900 [Theileria equi strain WA]AFZ80337.1 hypothetical protein BEWA_031900 [Theileria equi strain WA]|eukprot:XP_004830003.1 hypothetical protein BEWA_031900 [Theileria equi strain WA]